MKKMAFLALVLSMGLSMSAGAATIGIPWFVDTAPVGSTLPPQGGGITTIIYLNSNSPNEVVCEIQYFSSTGEELGPFTNNTFVIPPLSTVGFRPVRNDENTTANPNGQESAVAAAVPDRPLDVNDRPNGSARIVYDDEGGTVRITGKAESWGFRSIGGSLASMNSAYLLPE